MFRVRLGREVRGWWCVGRVREVLLLVFGFVVFFRGVGFILIVGFFRCY